MIAWLVLAVIVIAAWPWTALVFAAVLVLGVAVSRLARPRPQLTYHRSPRFASQLQREIIYHQYGGQCAHCGRQTRLVPYDCPDQAEIDHIRPWSRGGETTLDNLQLLCQTCNQAKSNRYVG